MAVTPVILMTNELATSTVVASALASNGKLANEDVCRDLAELKLRLERGPVPAALVDIDGGAANALLTGLDPIVRRFADTRFIVLSSAMQPELLLEAMQIGARHYMLKSSIPADLSAVLWRVCPDHVSGYSGDVVTVLSAGGGCGATTLAANFGNELAQTADDPVLIADLDPCYGAVGSYLGLEAEYGILDMLSRKSAIDGNVIATTAVRSSPKLSALLSTSAARLGEQMEFGADRIPEIVSACRQAFRYTVLDAPRISLASAAYLARNSARVFIVLQLTVKDIRVARRLINGLAEHGIDQRSICPVINRYRKRYASITLDEARRALGNVAVETIGNDFAAASKSANLGKPLAECAPRSEPRRDILRLTKSVADQRQSPIKADR